MEYHIDVLVTIDLPDVSPNVRDQFYNSLYSLSWIKLPKLTTAWRVHYVQPNIDFNKITIEIIACLEKAKIESKVKNVDYAFQVGYSPLVIRTM